MDKEMPLPQLAPNLRPVRDLLEKMQKNSERDMNALLGIIQQMEESIKSQADTIKRQADEIELLKEELLRCKEELSRNQGAGGSGLIKGGSGGGRQEASCLAAPNKPHTYVPSLKPAYYRDSEASNAVKASGGFTQGGLHTEIDGNQRIPPPPSDLYK